MAGMQRRLTAPVSELISEDTLIALHRAYPPPKKAPAKRGKARGGKKEQTPGTDA